MAILDQPLAHFYVCSGVKFSVLFGLLYEFGDLLFGFVAYLLPFSLAYSVELLLEGETVKVKHSSNVPLLLGVVERTGI